MKKLFVIIMFLPLLTGISESSPINEYKTILNKAGTIGIVSSPLQADYTQEFDQNKPFPTYNENSSEMFQVDLVSADLRQYDLQNRYNDLIHSSFDTKTKWPNILPQKFNPELIIETGKDPGLNIRKLHKKGIKGSDIGIAVLDSWLFVGHEEYRKQLKLYEEIHAFEEPTTHGTAISSIAVGKTVGVAPCSDLYYIAVSCGYFIDKSYVYDYSFLAQAINRICEINKQLPQNKKIRVLTITIRLKEERKDYDLAMKAIHYAEEQNIFVIYVGSRDYSGLYRDPLSNPNDFNSYRPGLYWEKRFYSNDKDNTKSQSLLIPSDSRSVASPIGFSDYGFDLEGGLSKTVPYIAGVYALACQVSPSITPNKFWDIALETGKTIIITKDGKDFKLGKIINPSGIIEELE